MTIPGPGETVHLMGWFDIVRVRWAMRCKQGRNVRELELYTTDDLRRLYHETNDDLIKLQDGILRRYELCAEIRWRVFWAQYGNFLMLIAAAASVVAAVAGVLQLSR